MNNKKPNMSDLEKELALVESDAVVEEQYNADRNYHALDNELEEVIAEIPFPETEKYSVSPYYDDIERLNYEKGQNAPYWHEKQNLEKYCSNGTLYTGHLRVNGTDYYFMDKHLVDTKKLVLDGEEVFLVNVDDRKYQDKVIWWRYPTENKNVSLSRNITMEDRKVSDVEIIFGSENEILLNISDAYLRKALIRNKDKSGMQSIIQTIQGKQNTIRSLPKEKSFIVQGCAGSGKTMVLLHRLRYLLNNKDFYDDEYIFLVPGNIFKDFIIDDQGDFSIINKKNIFPYSEYYQSTLGKKIKNEKTEKNELVFDFAYLERVYSKAFMQEIYGNLFDLLNDQTNSVVSFCEEKAGVLVEFEKSFFEKEIDVAKIDAIKQATEIVNSIADFTKAKIDDKFENIQILINEIEDTYSKRKEEYENASNSNVNITISPDDERLSSNEKLIKLKQGIEAEQLAIEKASVFTVNAHRNKLRKLQENYDLIREEFANALIDEDKKKYAQQASQLAYVYENISFENAEIILEKLKSIQLEAINRINTAKSNLENIDEYIGERFAEEIKKHTDLIEISGDIEKYKKDHVENLKPAYAIFEKVTSLGVELLEFYNRRIPTDKDKDVRDDLTLFTKRTQKQLYAYLNALLFNDCKRKITNEFGIRICDVYKHYWYLYLYCSFLTRPTKTTGKKYIFIDEAQDLSISEIELINKINSVSEIPILNLFGDINQTITTYGIKDWSQIQNIPEVYTLKENFRNTNQIVDYCNSNLTMQMEKVGVDMEQVNEYETINDAIENSKSIFDNAVFIVKDEYSEADLKNLLSKTGITNHEIYTVKSAKGLEFKEVFVFCKDMTLNEKYISYTRALMKLNVVKILPQTVDRTDTLIVQGEEQDDVIEDVEVSDN